MFPKDNKTVDGVTVYYPAIKVHVADQVSRMQDIINDHKLEPLDKKEVTKKFKKNATKVLKTQRNRQEEDKFVTS